MRHLLTVCYFIPLLFYVYFRQKKRLFEWDRNEKQNTCTVVHWLAASQWLKGRGVVVSGVRRINEVNLRRVRLLRGWVTVWGQIPYRYVTSQLGQLSLASFRGRLIEYQLWLG